MRKTIFRPLGTSKKDIAPAEEQWYIHVQKKYDEEKARCIKIFLSKYLDCWCYDEVDNGQAD